MKFSKIPTDVKMLKTKVDTLHNAFVSQADVNTISEGLRKYNIVLCNLKNDVIFRWLCQSRK